MTERMRAQAVAMTVAITVVGCGGSSRPRSADPAPTTVPAIAALPEVAALRAQLLASDELGPGFRMRQQLRFGRGERSGSFESVVQLDCGELLVLGLTSIGTRAFQIRQRGRDVEFAWFLPEPVAFEPERILLDVHRSFLYPLTSPAPLDGEHERTVGAVGVAVQERWRGGKIEKRRIEERLGHRQGTWVARYVGGWAPGEAPRTTLIESGLFGYSLEIETVERIPLECPP